MGTDCVKLADEQAAEIERLRAALREIASNEYSEFGGIGGIARHALRGKSVDETKT